jgi:hypothetical protein
MNLLPLPFQLAVFSLAVASLCSAFMVTNKATVTTSRMALIKPDMPGQIAPLGFFVPLGLSVGTTEKIYKRWQESEVFLTYFKLQDNANFISLDLLTNFRLNTEDLP